MVDDHERIWLSAANDDNEHEVWFDPDEGGTEYIRADKFKELQRQQLADFRKVSQRVNDLSRQLAEARAEHRCNIETLVAEVNDLRRDRNEARAERDEWYKQNLYLQRQIVGQAERDAELNYVRAERDRLAADLKKLCDWVEHEVGADLPFDARAALKVKHDA